MSGSVSQLLWCQLHRQAGGRAGRRRWVGSWRGVKCWLVADAARQRRQHMCHGVVSAMAHPLQPAAQLQHLKTGTIQRLPRRRGWVCTPSRSHSCSTRRSLVRESLMPAVLQEEESSGHQAGWQAGGQAGRPAGQCGASTQSTKGTAC